MFAVERVEDATVVYVSRDLDIASSRELASTLKLAVRLQPRRIIVSLEACTFCDATGLSALIAARNATSEFVVVLPETSVCRRIFEITGLCQRLNLVRTLREAFTRTFPLAV